MSVDAAKDFGRFLDGDVRARRGGLGDERSLVADAHMAATAAIDAGVHPFCLTLEGGGAECLPRRFGAGHGLVLDPLEARPQRLPEICLRPRQ